MADQTRGLPVAVYIRNQEGELASFDDSAQLVIQFGGDVWVDAFFSDEVDLFRSTVMLPAGTPLRLHCAPADWYFAGGPWKQIRIEGDPDQGPASTLWQCKCGWRTWMFLGPDRAPHACPRCMGLESLGEGGDDPE